MHTKYPPTYFGEVAPQLINRPQHGQLRVSKLVMRESNTYQDVEYRPYQTTGDVNAIHEFQETFYSKLQINPGDLSGFASSIIAPASQTRGTVPIAEGWSNKRLIFMMEVEVNRVQGYPEKIILTGFTDFMGAGRDGSLAPDMRLYFNNCIKTAQVIDNMSSIGFQSNIRVADASQVVYGNPFVVPQRGFHQQSQPSFNNVIYMRPVDVYGKMQANMFGNGTLDNRNSLSANHDAVRFSKATNSNPANYITRVVNNLRTAMNEADIHQLDWTQQLSKAQTYVPEERLRHNVLFTALKQYSDFEQGKSVTVRDLMQLSPDLDRVTVVVFNKGLDDYNRGNTEHFHGSTYESVFAYQLSHAVPALMMEGFLRKVHVLAHNNTLDLQWDVTIVEAHGFTDGVNLHAYIDSFKCRLVHESLNGLLPGYYVPVMLDISCDVVRDTIINISYNNGVMTPFLNPGFANNLNSPIITSQPTDLDLLTNDMESICTAVGLNDEVYHDTVRGNFNGFNPLV